MFSMFDVPNEIEGGVHIHFNFFLLGLGRPFPHGHPRWGLLIRAAAKAVARGKLFLGGNLSESGGTFPFLTSFCRNSGPKFAKGDKLWNALLIAGVRGQKSVQGLTKVGVL